MYHRGLSLNSIARDLQQKGIETSSSSVKRLVARHQSLFKIDDCLPPESPAPFWGLGGPGILELPVKTGDYTVAGIFDLHGEFREEKLFQAQLRVIQDLAPDLVVLGGDIDNFDIISRWQHKVLNRMTPLQIFKAIRKEIDEGRGIRERVRAAAEAGLGSGVVIIEVEGNHGDRLRKYLSDDLQEGWETSKEWRCLDETLDHYYNRAGVYIRPDFLVRHGSTTAQYPASKEYRDNKVSGWTGHLHNYHVHAEPPHVLKDERYIHTVAPASCRLDYNYGPGNAGMARWHQGMLVGSFSASNPHDHVTDVALWDRATEKLRLRGKLY